MRDRYLVELHFYARYENSSQLEWRLFECEEMKTFRYLRMPIGSVWCEITEQGELPSWPHPKLRKWGVWRDGGETMIYLGHLFIILTPARIA